MRLKRDRVAIWSAWVATCFFVSHPCPPRASGRVVKGGPDEATEVWTFMRKHGGGQWMLSAIQQAT